MAKKDEREQKKDTLASTVEQIKNRFGEGAIMKLGEIKKVDVEAIPTGSVSLDMALGVGGLPKGRIVEIYGPESSGKTTLALHVVAQAQKKGGLCAFVDAEHAMDPDYAAKLGVNTKELLISQPDSGEQALGIVETLVQSGAVSLIVVDSVAALTPQKEIEGEIGDQHVGLQARLMSQALRKLTPIAHKSGTTIIFINQLRMKIGIMFGNPEETPGGRALKFHASVRLDVRRIAQLKKGEDVIGSRVRVKVAKNKVAPPFKNAEFDIMWNEGISYEGDLLGLAAKYAILQKSGTWLSYNGQKLGQGSEGAKQFLKENPKIAQEMHKKIMEKYLETKS